MSTPTTSESVLNRLADEAAAATPKPPVQPVDDKPKEPPVAEPAKELAKPPEEKPTEGQPPAVEPEEQELDLDEPAEASGSFDEFKPVFDSHPELKTKLKQIIGREAAYSELGTFSEVKQIIERVPTLEDAETISSQAENHRAMQETFRNDPSGFAETLKQSDPLAFSQFVANMPEILRQEEPEAWTRQARSYTSEVLSNAYSIAQNSNDAELAKALQLVYQSLGLSGAAPSRPAAVDPELARLRKEKTEREKADTEAQFETFWNSTDRTVINESVAIIEEQLKKALPNATEKQMQRMVSEAWDKTLEMLGSQPQTMAQIETFRKNAQKGRMGIAEHKQIVAYSLGRAKLAIPKTVRAVVNEWTKEVLRVNSETTDKKKAIAANSRDAGTGPQGTTAVTQQPSGDKGKRRTTEDVFRELENKTYVAPAQRTPV